jgi:hypothetical protein
MDTDEIGLLKTNTKHVEFKTNTVRIKLLKDIMTCIQIKTICQQKVAFFAGHQM